MNVACGALFEYEGSKNLTHETKKYSANLIGTTYPTFCIMHSAFLIIHPLAHETKKYRPNQIGTTYPTLCIMHSAFLIIPPPPPKQKRITRAKRSLAPRSEKICQKTGKCDRKRVVSLLTFHNRYGKLVGSNVLLTS
jgi:hypothetical protein